MPAYAQGWSTRSVSFQALQDLITKTKYQINSLTIFLESLARNNVGKKIRRFNWLSTLWVLFALLTPTSLFGEESDKESKTVRPGSLQEDSKSKSNFVLTIKDNLISLDAKDASLVKIIEEIGSRMKIEVITKIPEEKKISTKFDKLPMEPP